jgi:hypothetical protein
MVSTRFSWLLRQAVGEAAAAIIKTNALTGRWRIFHSRSMT